MIVCLCNALGERECREAAARPGVRGPGCVYRALGCRVRCGACVATMREIVTHVRTPLSVQAEVALPLVLQEK